MNLNDLEIGVSPITDKIYLYKKRNKLDTDNVGEKIDITQKVIGALDYLLNCREIKFTGKDREFWLTTEKPTQQTNE